MSRLRYEGKVAVVTGGGSGLGRDMAESFAREGAHVCVIGRRQEKLDEVVRGIEGAGGRAFGLSADVRDVARIEAVMKEIGERAGRIDVLVNNAAGNFIAPAEQLSPLSTPRASLRTARNSAVRVSSTTNRRIVACSRFHSICGGCSPRKEIRFYESATL